MSKCKTAIPLNAFLFSILNMDTSERINRLMAEHGLKPSDIMSATGASRGAVSQWRNGIVKPSGERLLRLARLLHTTPDWLLAEEYPFSKAFIVDVIVGTVKEKPVTYTVIKLHEAIDIPE